MKVLSKLRKGKKEKWKDFSGDWNTTKFMGRYMGREGHKTVQENWFLRASYKPKKFKNQKKMKIREYETSSFFDIYLWKGQLNLDKRTTVWYYITNG